MSVTVQVFDPAMCCPTGVCGPFVDPQLTRFAADLQWLKGTEVIVERFNLAQQPQAFVEHALSTSHRSSTIGSLSLAALINEISLQGHRVVMTMGKGGVGKTTVAGRIATKLARPGRHDPLRDVPI